MLAFSVFWAIGVFHALTIWLDGQLTLGQVVAYIGLFGGLRFPTFISLYSFDLVQLGMAGEGDIVLDGSGE